MRENDGFKTSGLRTAWEQNTSVACRISHVLLLLLVVLMIMMILFLPGNLPSCWWQLAKLFTVQSKTKFPPLMMLRLKLNNNENSSSVIHDTTTSVNKRKRLLNILLLLCCVLRKLFSCRHTLQCWLWVATIKYFTDRSGNTTSPLAY